MVDLITIFLHISASLEACYYSYVLDGNASSGIQNFCSIKFEPTIPILSLLLKVASFYFPINLLRTFYSGFCDFLFFYFFKFTYELTQ